MQVAPQPACPLNQIVTSSDGIELPADGLAWESAPRRWGGRLQSRRYFFGRRVTLDLVTAVSQELEAGVLLLDKYRIDAVIGRGGMGVVLAATHVALEEKVAIKVLKANLTTDDEARGRFLREAQSAVKLKSEHVTRVHDIGVLPDGSPFMVMEYLEGMDLDQMVKANGATSPPLAASYLLQACEGLAEAHARGIIHRDIKPSNIFVTWRADGSPLLKLLDFGISRAVQADGELSLTRTASILGTPAFMSPEQMRSSRRVDARTDIWSLGVVMYELLEARWPFAAESFTEMCVKVSADPPEPMTCAPELQTVVFRCLEKDPATRFANVGELASAIAPHVSDPREAALRVERIKRILARSTAFSGVEDTGPAHTAQAPAQPGGSGPVRIAAVTPPAGVRQPRLASAVTHGNGELLGGPRTGVIAASPQPPSRRRALVIGGVAAAALAVGIVGFAVTRGGSAPAVPAASGGSPSTVAAPAPDATPDAAVLATAPPSDAALLVTDAEMQAADATTATAATTTPGTTTATTVTATPTMATPTSSRTRPVPAKRKPKPTPTGKPVVPDSAYNQRR